MAGGWAGVGGRERAGARRGLPGEEMPLVPHPPSTRTGSGGRSASGEEGGAPQIGRAPSGGRQRDVGALAGAKKQDLPTLNMEKIGLESRGEVSQALGSHRMGTANAAQVLRGRQYTGGQARQPGAQPQGPQAERAPQQPSTGQPRPAPAPRRVVPTAGGEIKHLVPHPPSAGVRSGGGGQPAHSLGNGGVVGAQPDLPDRNKVEPTHPLTARPVPTQQGEGKARQAAGAVPQTARATIDSEKVQPQAQKYDEVSKPSATGGSNVPLTPAAALKLYMTQMTLYEQGEILDFPQVFYVGPNAAKHRPSADAADNHGFDDDRGDYIWVSHDHIAYRYEILGILGKGSFGVVAKVFDWKTNQLMALKIIRNKKRFHHQALVEVKLLEHLRDHDADGTASIVYMRDYFYFRNHMCITFELLCINLYEFIKNNKFQGLSLGLIRRIAVQLLLSLRFLRKLRVIHCDLKPENILLKAPNKSSIKVIDFGSSCFENERVYTYIQSRFYRSPEVILGLPYDMAIDMWSFGCILAELYTGYPIFPGENEVEQLTCILALCEAHARTHARARTHTHTHTHHGAGGAAGVYHGAAGHPAPPSHRAGVTPQNVLRLQRRAEDRGEFAREKAAAKHKGLGVSAAVQRRGVCELFGRVLAVGQEPTVQPGSSPPARVDHRGPFFSFCLRAVTHASRVRLCSTGSRLGALGCSCCRACGDRHHGHEPAR